MKSLQEMAQILNRLIGSRSLARRGVRGRRHWAAEALEVRTLLTMPLYVLQTGSDNPMNGLASGTDFLESHPVLVNLDADHDLDLVVGRGDGISYFENTDTVLAPTFTERTGALNPFTGLGAGVTPAPALADWDADGDLDLLLATFAGLTAFKNMSYENWGSAMFPSFAPLVGLDNPFAGISTAVTFTPVPAFADMDGDGDLDLVVSRSSSRMAYYKNIGTSTLPSYDSGVEGDPFSSVTLGSLGSPALGNVDGDRDVDLVTGSFPGGLKFFENTGTKFQANLTNVTGVFNDQLNALATRFAPALGDLDGDGDQDLLLATQDVLLPNGPLVGVFRYYKAVANVAPQNTVPGVQLAKEDIAIVFSDANRNALSVADPNANDSDLQVTLSADHGTLTLATTHGLDFELPGDGVNDATMTVRGTLVEINAALNGLIFLPAVDFYGSANLTIATNDLGQPGGGGELSDTDLVPILVLSVATQVEQLQGQIDFLVIFTGLNQGAANALLHLLNLTGQPAVDAIRIKVFMLVVRVFGRAGTFTDEGTDLFLLELAQDILTGITTRAD